MSTRSYIGILTPEGKIRAIYCHNDGYISFVGRILQNYYNTREKVEKLLELGNISCLGKYIAPRQNQEHTFDSPAKYVTVAYHRDRGEDYNSAQEYDSVKDYNQSITTLDACMYLYLFDGENWYVSDPSDKHRGFYRYTTTRVFHQFPLDKQ